ncbi:MAG: PAS domain S-box protein [Hyphomonas sp.]
MVGGEQPVGLGANEEVLSHLAAIVAGSSDAILSITLDGIVQTWNAAAEKLFGYSASEIVGSSIRLLVPPDREAEEDELLAKLSRGESITNFATMRLRKDGQPVPLVVTMSPIRDSALRVVGASKIARDLSETQRAEDRLRESEDRLSILADNISQLAWMAEPDGDIFWYNRRWYEYTGTTFEEVQGWGWRAVHHPDHVDRVVERIQHSWDTGEPWEDTFPLRGRDGSFRWFLSRALPIRDDSGTIVRWFGTNTDVTEDRRQQEHIQLLMHETNHRAKNTLGLVQAIARQTAASQAEREFVERFSSRLIALAANQDVLVKAGWQGGDVQTLIRAQLAHFGDLLDSRILLDGPTLRLTTAAVQVFGMALHELATNAGKYGALSVDTGQIHISWMHDPSAGKFRIEWTETGGPEVRPPESTGFGSILLGRMARLSLNADISLDFAPTGLSWKLECPQEKAILDLDAPAETSS